MQADQPSTALPPSATDGREPPATPPQQQQRHIALPTIVEPADPTPQGSATDSPRRSPRLGQATFDAAVAHGGQEETPPYTAAPRLLFTSSTRTGNSDDLEDGDKIVSPSLHQWVLGPGEPDGPPATPSSLSPSHGPPAPDVASTARPLPAIRPSFRTLFSLTSRSTLWTVVVPGTVFAIGSGLIPPAMTMILGDSLQAFTDYGLATGVEELSADALKSARATLMHDVRLHAVKFAILAAVVLVTSSANIALWVIHGERVARELRNYVYRGVTAKGMEWYETGMGGEPDGGRDSATSAVDAAGLTGRFSKCARFRSLLLPTGNLTGALCGGNRDTDDVRIGSAQTIGLVMQYLSSSLFCIMLAFYRNWRLAFVVLATIPGVIAVVALTERWSGPLANRNRATTAECTSRVNRIVGAIATVKAFNAEKYEQDAFERLTHDDWAAYVKLHFVWGLRSGLTQFLLMAMFVQGFWYGATLISSGRSTPASVNTSFWACLLGSSYLQTCIPSLVALEKAKIAMAGLLQLARVETNQDGPPIPPTPAVPGRSRGPKRGLRGAAAGTISWPIPMEEKLGREDSPPTTPTLASLPAATYIPLSGLQGKRRSGQAPRALRKLRPATFSGEMSLRGVTFHYPARPPPAAPALQDVSMYFAARETTYVVGTSGSGKSTVGSLLLGLYKLDAGRVEIDEQGLDWIDEEWLRGHVACVSQGASVLFEGTVHDNVAVGIVGQLQEDGSTRSLRDVSRDEVVAACRAALLHDFVRDLPLGYDTPLSGERGASLSGGQRQRLAIARAYIRNPTVLILGRSLLSSSLLPWLSLTPSFHRRP
jgi:ATP-binding cassette subfamily B (MDR/TAP) protein 1